MTKFDESDEEDDHISKVTSLTEFSAETIAVEAVKAPLVVPRIENTFRNGGKVYRPQALQREPKNGLSIEELEANERSRNNVYGLSKAAKSTPQIKQEAGPDVIATNLEARDKKQATTSGQPFKNETEVAISEILNPSVKEDGLIIQSSRSNVLFDGKPTGFADDHPDMSTLEDYENVPVEEFGLAMLRGMGFIPPSADKKAGPKQADRRPDFLGLGASERPEETKSKLELEKKRFQKRMEERIYVPVVKRNKRTGEIVTEGPLITSAISDSKNSRGDANGNQGSEVRPLYDQKSHKERMTNREAASPSRREQALRETSDHQHGPSYRKNDHERSKYRHETRTNESYHRSRDSRIDREHDSRREIRDTDKSSRRDRSRDRDRRRDKYRGSNDVYGRRNESDRHRDRRRSRSR